VVELGFCSLYEFIYSFRKNETSLFPEITSNEAVKALEKIKEIMKKLSSGLYNKYKYINMKFFFNLIFIYT